ncbi:MAG: hypothetical protein NVS4B7_06350 [Ktedonobacteraceae bacterium]
MDKSFNQDELSADDLAIIQAFENLDMEDWEVGSPSGETGRQSASISESNDIRADEQSSNPLQSRTDTRTHDSSQSSADGILTPEDMFAIYVAEADEDMSSIRRALQQLEPDEHLDAFRLQTIQRTAHKMKGTAGAIGYTITATLAHHMEELTILIMNGAIVPFIGLNALVQTVRALEMTLNSVVTYNQEITAPLAELEAEYKVLNIDVYSNSLHTYTFTTQEQENMPVRIPFNAAEEDEGPHPGATTKPFQEPSTPFVRVGSRRFEQLVLHGAQLAELSAPLENAQTEVERAMHELHDAQSRLQHLETSLSSSLILKNASALSSQANIDERPTSSLVALILDQATQRTGHSYQRKNRLQYRLPLLRDESLRWDALEIDRFTESDVLAHSLSEAIADVAMASSQLRVAFAQLHRLTQKLIAQVINVRNDTSLLRLTPMHTLLSRIERVVAMSGIAQQRQIQFEVAGGTTEIDQDILEELKQPLLQLVRTCLANDLSSSAQQTEQTQADKVDRIWCFVHAVGNEITIEIGFSQPIGGGSLNEVQVTIRRLNGSISAQRNDTGSVSFYLRLPRSQGAVHGLLVSVEHQHIIVPLSQVQRIDNGHQNSEHYLSPGQNAPAILNTLLGFPMRENSSAAVRPVLIFQPTSHALHPLYAPHPLAVQVDEVLGTVKLVVKPLAPHLQRPGIAGNAIDGMGNVLLVVDVPELVRHQQSIQQTAKVEKVMHKSFTDPEQTQLSVLIADDSIYIRQSLSQTLSRVGYSVITARDGMQALELLLNNPPRALILDVEMPNLNGYDLLSIMHIHPELANVKVIMLTSRSSEKHQARALALGAHTYLTKPCPQDTLLATLKQLLLR